MVNNVESARDWLATGTIGALSETWGAVVSADGEVVVGELGSDSGGYR